VKYLLTMRLFQGSKKSFLGATPPSGKKSFIFEKKIIPYFCLQEVPWICSTVMDSFL
jgi:hypothetical protein